MPVDVSTIDSYIIMPLASSATLITGGSNTDVTFTVVDNDGGVLEGVPLQLSLENPAITGAALTTTSVVSTDSTGQVNTGVVQGANTVNSRLNHNIVVNASIVTPVYDADGNTTLITRAEESVIIDVEGTTIAITADDTSLIAGEEATITTILIDGQGNPISGATMELVDADGNVIESAMTTQSDSAGVAEFTVNESDLPFDDNGNLAVYARATGEQDMVQQTSLQSVNLIQASQAGMSFIDLDRVYDVNETQNLNIQIRSDDAASLVGETVRVETSLGTLANSQVLEDIVITADMVNGAIITVPVELTSTLAGTAVLNARILGLNNASGQPQFQASSETRFRATTPAKMLFQAVRSVIKPGSSTEVVATIKDANDVPVEGVTVVFSRSADSSAGRLSAATAVTNSQGEARVTYTSNASSPINSVVINAQLLDDQFGIGQKQTQITVSDEAVYATLAFSSEITSSADEIYYTLPASISVMDGSGRAIANQEVSLKSFATKYAQGVACGVTRTVTYQPPNTFDAFGNEIVPAIQDSTSTYVNMFTSSWYDTEDPDYNYTLDNGDDVNNNGTLEPINPVSIIGGNLSDDEYTFVTDDEGKVDFEIRYPKMYSSWVQVQFVSTTLVNGSENTQSHNLQLPVAADELELSGTTAITPYVNNTSPFGSGGQVCINDLSVNIDGENNTTEVSGMVSGLETNVMSSLQYRGNIVGTAVVPANYPQFYYSFNYAFALGAKVTVTVGNTSDTLTLQVD